VGRLGLPWGSIRYVVSAESPAATEPTRYEVRLPSDVVAELARQAYAMVSPAPELPDTVSSNSPAPTVAKPSPAVLGEQPDGTYVTRFDPEQFARTQAEIHEAIRADIPRMLERAKEFTAKLEAAELPDAVSSNSPAPKRRRRRPAGEGSGG
jgi:hypothetical protein